MAQTTSPKLDGGDQFPSMSMKLVDGDIFKFPEDLSAPFSILLIYRGKW